MLSLHHEGHELGGSYPSPCHVKLGIINCESPHIILKLDGSKTEILMGPTLVYIISNWGIFAYASFYSFECTKGRKSGPLMVLPLLTFSIGVYKIFLCLIYSSAPMASLLSFMVWGHSLRPWIFVSENDEMGYLSREFTTKIFPRSKTMAFTIRYHTQYRNKGSGTNTCPPCGSGMDANVALGGHILKWA